MLVEHPVASDITWPGGGRLAVVVTFDYQGIVGLPPSMTAAGRHDLKLEKEFSYETKIGIFRVLDTLERHGVRATFPTCGRTVELYPESCRELVARGHEIAAHGYDHEKLSELSLGEETKIIDRTLASFDDVLGLQPRGWRTPYYACTEETVSLLAERGIVWQSDFHDDDLPYFVETAHGWILQIPPAVDDWRNYWTDIRGKTPTVRGSPRNILQLLIDSFDVLLAESRQSSKVLCMTLHPQIVGRPDRIVILEEFLRHAIGSQGVWWPRCIDVWEHLQSAAAPGPDVPAKPTPIRGL